MKYEIEIRKRAEKDLFVIPKSGAQKIADAIFALENGLVGDIKRLTNFSPEYRLRVGNWRILFEMSNSKIIEKSGKKEFAVIPYKDFVRMQEELDDYYDLLALRQAKADSRNQKGRSFDALAEELGLEKKKV